MSDGENVNLNENYSQYLSVRIHENQRGQFLERPLVNPPLEKNDLRRRGPEVHPAPILELGTVGSSKVQSCLLGPQAQQKPHLLLADALRLPAHLAVFWWQSVSEPAFRAPNLLDIMLCQPDFLLKLSVHRLQRRLALGDTPLRKLPSAPAHPAAPEDLIRPIDEDDANIAAESVAVNHASYCILPRLMPRVAALPFYVVLTVLLIAALVFALGWGSVSLPPRVVLATLVGGGDDLARTVILELRLPRAVAAFVTGGLLALAGALMQVLLRNPLADPYILGVSGGAAVFALGAIMLGLGSFWIGSGAFAGALLSTLLVFVLAHGRGGWTPTRLLLTGVVIAAGWGAVISLMLALGPDGSLRGMLFWLMGDLSHTEMPWNGLVVLTFGAAMAIPFARPLNILARGELQAGALGVAVRPLSIGIYVLASLLTATAVTMAGAIGFVGLVVPHMLRLIAGTDHRRLLPGCVLLGGTLLLVADTVARTALAPQQLPVGVVTALVGVPLFLYLLHRARQ